MRGVTRQVGNEIDEFVTEALRNNLLGLPLDLPTINLARGRDTGVPTLNAGTRANSTPDRRQPTQALHELGRFRAHLKHRESLVNFIAAYGTHVSITSATTTARQARGGLRSVYGGRPRGAGRRATSPTCTGAGRRLRFLNGAAPRPGVDDIDLWIGGLAEKQMPFGGLLGSTFNFVFETQIENLQNGDRFYYLDAPPA